jgi:hypothetical protein
MTRALFGAGAVLIAHALTRRAPARLGSYRTGIMTLSVFLIAILYYVRKHNLWLSARLLRSVARLPQAAAQRLILLDRLETWRMIHVTAGVLLLLPFWWHTEAGPATPLETMLKGGVLLLVLTGLIGVTTQALLPHEMELRGDQEVRPQDVDQRLHELYVEAEEAILGHSEALIRAYLKNIRPLMANAHPGYRFFWATMSRTDPARPLCAAARAAAADLGSEQTAYEGLVAIAERKIRLEHNRFNLRFNKTWLRYHIGLFMLVAVMVVFHVAGVLYFAGV